MCDILNPTDCFILKPVSLSLSLHIHLTTTQWRWIATKRRPTSFFDLQKHGHVSNVRVLHWDVTCWAHSVRILRRKNRWSEVYGGIWKVINGRGLSTYLFVCSFILSFICPFSFICSFFHLFICLFLHRFICSFLHRFICSFVRSFIRSFVHSFFQWLVDQCCH